MDPIVTIIIVLVVSALLAFVLVKLGFTLTKIKVKLGLAEAEITRSPKSSAESGTGKKQAGSSGAQFTQEATDGGILDEATIKAPADSPAGATQKAEGEGSRIKKSRIELD